MCRYEQWRSQSPGPYHEVGSVMSRNIITQENTGECSWNTCLSGKAQNSEATRKKTDLFNQTKNLKQKDKRKFEGKYLQFK